MIWLKRIITALVLLLVLAVALALYLSYKYQDKIVPYAIEELNRYVTTPVSVQAVNLSFIERFPEANIKLEHVVAIGSNGARQNDTLFAVKKVYLTFDLIQLYKGEYVLNQVEFHDGKVNLHKDQKGLVNYTFIANADTVETNKNFSVNLSNILLKHVDIRYTNELDQQDIHVYAQKFSAKGQFGSGLQNIALYGTGTIHKVLVKSDLYINNEPIFVDAGLEFNNEESFYQISRGILNLREKYDLTVTGKFGKEEWQLNAQASNIDLEALPAMLPAYLTKPISDFKGAGKLAVQLALNKKKNQKRVAISSQFSVRNGKLEVAALNQTITNLHANASFTNNSGQNNLKLDTIAFALSESTFMGRAMLKNMTNPSIELTGIANLDLASLKKELNQEQIKTLKGKAKAKLHFKGEIPLADTNYLSVFKSWNKHIETSIHNVEIETKDHHVIADSGDLTIQNAHFAFDGLSGSYNGTIFKASGFSSNGFTNMLNQESPKTLEGEIAIGYYKVQSDTNTGRFAIPEGYNYKLKLLVDTLIYHQLEAYHSLADVQLNKSLKITNFNTTALGGKLSGNASFSPYQNGILTKINVFATEIDIKETFYTFNDFEQAAISYTHLKGTADLKADFSFVRDYEGNTQTKSIDGQADLRIVNGELIDYKPLYSIVTDFRKNKFLSLFIKLDDFEEKLKHVKFDTLENSIRIKNETVFIPAMHIKTSALDLELNGKQTFANELNYNVGFNLKQVLLAKNYQPTETEYGYIQDDGTGNKMIYLSISGTADEPVVKLDKAAAKAHRKAVVNQEIKTTKSVLNEELGLFKNDTTLKPQPQEKIETPGIDLEGFDKQLENPKQPDLKPVNKPDSTSKKSKWKKLLEKASGEQSKSKFENWEFEENDDW